MTVNLSGSDRPETCQLTFSIVTQPATGRSGRSAARPVPAAARTPTRRRSAIRRPPATRGRTRSRTASTTGPPTRRPRRRRSRSTRAAVAGRRRPSARPTTRRSDPVGHDQLRIPDHDPARRRGDLDHLSHLRQVRGERPHRDRDRCQAAALRDRCEPQHRPCRPGDRHVLDRGRDQLEQQAGPRHRARFGARPDPQRLQRDHPEPGLGGRQRHGQLRADHRRDQQRHLQQLRRLEHPAARRDPERRSPAAEQPRRRRTRRVRPRRPARP